MKKILITFINLTVCIIAFGQDKIEKATSAIVAEGKQLYKSEMASWYGTDIFLEKFGDYPMEELKLLLILPIKLF